MYSMIAGLVVMLFFFSAAVRPAHAEFSFNLEVRETYEDNVIGIVADNPNVSGITGGGGDRHGGRTTTSGTHLAHGLDDNLGSGGTGTAGGGGATTIKGDFSTGISIAFGVSQEMSDRVSFLVDADVHHTGYRTFNQFDFTIGSLGAGVSGKFTEDISGKAVLRGAIKSYKDNQRNGTAVGASISLKEKITGSFSLREFYDYEKNHANSQLFSYDAHSAGIWAMYAFFEKMTAGVGYAYLKRDYQGSPTFALTSQTLSGDLTWDITGGWSMNAGYDREVADSNIPNSRTINNIYSVGLMFSY